jgi:replicative DNA helicase
MNASDPVSRATAEGAGTVTPQRDGGHAADSRRLEALTARATMALPEPDEDARLLGDYVIRDARTVIAGASGHGKTSLAYAMVRAIVTGAEFLGDTGAGVGPAMIVDLEHGKRSRKRALREAGLADRDDVFMVSAPDGLALDSDDGTDLAEFERLIVEIRPVVVVLDPYYKAHRVEANEERPVVDLMRKLDGLREKYEFALILPAHVRKDQR